MNKTNSSTSLTAIFAAVIIVLGVGATAAYARGAVVSGSKASPIFGAASSSGMPYSLNSEADDSDSVEAEANEMGSLADAVAEIAAAYPTEFSYSDIQSGTFIVAFAAQIPEGAMPLLAVLGENVQVLENVGFSSADLEVEVMQISESLEKAADGKILFDIAALPQQGVIEVNLYTDDFALAESLLKQLTITDKLVGLSIRSQTISGSVGESS